MNTFSKQNLILIDRKYRSSILPNFFPHISPIADHVSLSFLKDSWVATIDWLFYMFLIENEKKRRRKKNLMGGIICNKTAAAVCFQQTTFTYTILRKMSSCHFLYHTYDIWKPKIKISPRCKSHVGFVWLKNHMSFLLYLQSKKLQFFVGE